MWPQLNCNLLSLCFALYLLCDQLYCSLAIQSTMLILKSNSCTNCQSHPLQPLSTPHSTPCLVGVCLAGSSRACWTHFHPCKPARLLLELPCTPTCESGASRQGCAKVCWAEKAKQWLIGSRWVQLLKLGQCTLLCCTNGPRPTSPT